MNWLFNLAAGGDGATSTFGYGPDAEPHRAGHLFLVHITFDSPEPIQGDTVCATFFALTIYQASERAMGVLLDFFNRKRHAEPTFRAPPQAFVSVAAMDYNETCPDGGPRWTHTLIWDIAKAKLG